jgi:glucose/arabinose dehydrogenase
MVFDRPPRSSGPLARQNAPFTIATGVALAALTWFSLTQDVLGTQAASEAPETTAIATPTSEATESSEVTDTAAGVPDVIVPADAAAPLQGLATEILLDDLSQPVFATTAPGDDRIYIVQRGGTIRIYDPDTDSLLPDAFLDVTSKSNASIGIEVGLLGLAFHPRYVDNGRLFIYYTDSNNDTAVAEYARMDADHADSASGEVFISVAREGVRHNAGMLLFGPDGYLYIAIGDGGLFEEFGQDTSVFLGTILRLDMDSGDPYATPDDNPFSAGGGAPELWAYGLRNPWRFSIDRATNTMFIGDVGQADAEEINAVALEPVGYNFGWPVLEGSSCWIPREGCDRTGKEMPVAEYDHVQGCSVTSGYVYRGSAIPEYFGHYFYADWCLGWVRSFEHTSSGAINHEDWSDDLGNPGQITSFGLDASGEMLYTTFEGTLGRIIPVR